MTPGAALPMPRDTWHHTMATRPLSLTFGLFTLTALDVLLQEIRTACLTDPRFRRPLALGSPAERGRPRTGWTRRSPSGVPRLESVCRPEPPAQLQVSAAPHH